MIPKLKVLSEVDLLDPAPDYTGTAGAYVSVVPDPESKSTFISILSDLGSEAEPEGELHCTVMYSLTTPPNILHVQPEIPFKAIIKGVKWWPGHNNEGYIVAILESQELTDRHNQWKAVGCVPTFEEYTPHVTLMIGCKAEDYEDEMEDATAYYKMTPVFFIEEHLCDNESVLEDIERQKEEYPDTGFATDADGRVSNYNDIEELHHRGLDWMDEGDNDLPNR